MHSSIGICICMVNLRRNDQAADLPKRESDASIEALRRLLSIALLAFLGLPFVTTLYGATAESESNLPACCRRAGKHHCAAAIHEHSLASVDDKGFRAPRETCPYYPASLLTPHHPDSGLAPAAAAFAAIVSHPTVQAQTESWARIARERSRNKRGPPSFFLL
jgi:hypothetical protein